MAEAGRVGRGKRAVKLLRVRAAAGGEDDPAEDVADMVVVRGEEGKQDEVAGYSMVVAPK